MASGWRIEFLLQTQALKGKIDVEDLRSELSAIPLRQAVKNASSEVGYDIQWDFAVQQYPDIHFIQPYISWTDRIQLKPGSKIMLYGFDIPISLAVINGSTTNHLRKMAGKQSKDLTRVINSPEKKSDHEIFFSVHKVDQDFPNDASFENLSQELFPVHSKPTQKLS
ncbi:MAG: hypothetical protein COV44_06665 [Deltaproteobacteria bacterium CG11_big_fil_rev_8_21_14_0_20_45_16]|nr:MAG: hypothetical protein COV44_06665 [Deltaproteobacteria bacterium CG11_big_fil_rev_8_21_14_0_20_45_16]